MSAGQAPLVASDSVVESDVASLIQIVGRVVRARVSNAAVAEDLIPGDLAEGDGRCGSG